MRLLALALLLLACTQALPPGAGPGAVGSGSGGEPVPGYRLREARRPLRSAEARRLRERYPQLFESLTTSHEGADADVRVPRADLLREPADARSYDAMNALAVVFFELHRRAERERHTGSGRFLTANLRATQVLAVSWRAYRDIEVRALRSAILDFYEDVLLGRKAGLEAARGRFVPMVASFAEHEPDPALRARIDALVERGRRPAAD